MTTVVRRFSDSSMIKDNKIYFKYEGYIDIFGHSRRPALVRHSRKEVRGYHYNESEEIEVVSLFIDGKMIENALEDGDEQYRDDYAIVLLEPDYSRQRELPTNDMVARPFDANSKDDWCCLFYDASEFNRMGDRLAYAIIAIALDKYYLSLPILKEALNILPEPARTQVLDLIKYASYGLSINKIEQVNELCRSYGRPADSFFPEILVDTAKQYGISYSTYCVHSLVDKLFEQSGSREIEKPSTFTRFMQWLDDDTFSISLQELDSCFAYLGEEKRRIAIRRYFLDVKNGVFNYDPQSLKAFSSQNYQYYSTLRYIFEGWPGNRNVSTEFFLDCLNTYEKTNQQHFQVSDGILDWAIQKSIEVNRPIEMNFNDWLCYCEGGILINKSFRGFATFEIKYELDDFAFEEESLKKNIHSIVRQNCWRLSHEEDVTQIDPESGEPIINPKTKQPLITKRRVLENRWKLHNQGDKRLVDLFVNWEKKPKTEPDNDVFTPEMVDYSIVRDQVEQYLNATYGTTTPYVSERKPDGILKMFAYEIGMRVKLDDDIILGENPGVEEDIVKQRIRERMAELFGETFECEYDSVKYHRAIVDSLFRLTGGSKQCFEKRAKMYRYERKIYCAPELTDLPNLLTGKKCANCQGDMCFVTGIKKNPNWKEYTLIHILEIIGYHVLEETEAGLIPNPVYIQFVTQINKAIRFTKRLVCKECGHILFPAREKGHSRFKCLMPACPEYNKEVYLNFCHDCKKGIIDSRDTKQCPNGMYICPSCNSCCSNRYFEYMSEQYRILGKKVPLFISRNMGNGHKDRNMFFCPICGTQKVEYVDNSGHKEWRCLVCKPIQEVEANTYEMIDDRPPCDEYGVNSEPWA